MRTLFLHCGDCGLDIEVRAASPEGEQRISGGFNCPACLVPLAFETRAEQGSGVEGAGGEPPRRCICGHDGCGYTTCPDCPTHGDEWPKSFKHRVAPAALGSRPSVITAPVEKALEAIRERWGQGPKSKGKK